MRPSTLVFSPLRIENCETRQARRRQVVIVQTAQMASALPGCEGVTEIGSAWCRHPADIGVQLHIVKRICAATTSSGPPLGSTLTSSTAAAASRPRPPAVSTCRISPKGTLGHAHFVAIWSGRESSISLSPGREESDFPSARRYVCMPYRESGGPEPAPGLNMGQPLWPCSPWIPAFEAVIQLVSTSMVTILI